MRFGFSLLYFLFPISLFAQMNFSAGEIKAGFPDENFYFLSDKSSVTISVKEDKLEIISTISSDVLFLTEKAPQFSRRSVYYYDETEEVSNVKASSIIPIEKGKTKKVEVTNTFTHKPIKNGVFYDDFKEIYFDFPGLKEGAVASMSYDVKTKDPHFIDPFYFANNSPSRYMEYSISFPKQVKLKYFLKGDTSNIRFKVKEDKNLTTYTWSVNDQKAFDKVREEGNYRRYAPHVIAYIESYKIREKEIPVLGDVSRLYAWYTTHINELMTEPDKNVKSLADSLTAGMTDNKEKIKSIYYWVQENIKYIAFEYGLGGFVPRKADLVQARRFGDCKDKSSLMYSLLRSVEIPAYITWIGTRDIPYTYNELPTPAVDNHMIISVHTDNQWVFLDGTSSYLPLGYPSGFIQEKEALIGISPDSFLIAPVPIVSKDKNFKIDSLNLTFNDDGLTGKGFTAFGGLWRNTICNAFYDIADKEKEKEMSKMLIVGNNKCRIDSITYFGLTGYNDSLSFSYQISLPDYYRKIDNKVYVNLNLNRTLQAEEVLIEKRKTEERYKFTYVIKEVSTLSIPENYTIEKLPMNSSYKGKYYGYSISYRTNGSGVWMEKEIYFDRLQKDPSEFSDWNQMVSKITDAYSQVVVLARK